MHPASSLRKDLWGRFHRASGQRNPSATLPSNFPFPLPTTLFLSFPLFRRHWPRHEKETARIMVARGVNRIGRGVWVALVLDSKILARPAGATSDFFIGRRRRRRRRECSVLALFFQPLTPPSARSPLFRFSSPSTPFLSLSLSLQSISGRLLVAFLLSSSSSVVRRFIFVGLVLSSLFSSPASSFPVLRSSAIECPCCGGRKYKCGGLLGL